MARQLRQFGRERYFILSVSDKRVLVEQDVPQLALALQQQLGYETYLLNGARALSIKYTSTPILFSDDDEESKPIIDSINGLCRVMLKLDRSINIPLVVPDPLYYAELDYPQYDVGPFDAFYLQSEYIEDWSKLEVAIRFWERPSVAFADRVKDMLQSWHAEGSSTGFGGQILTPIAPTIRVHGPELRMKVPCEGAIVYPAIEIFLRCLTGLKVEERPQYLRFQNA